MKTLSETVGTASAVANAMNIILAPWEEPLLVTGSRIRTFGLLFPHSDERLPALPIHGMLGALDIPIGKNLFPSVRIFSKKGLGILALLAQRISGELGTPVRIILEKK